MHALKSHSTSVTHTHTRVPKYLFYSLKWHLISTFKVRYLIIVLPIFARLLVVVCKSPSFALLDHATQAISLAVVAKFYGSHYYSCMCNRTGGFIQLTVLLCMGKIFTTPLQHLSPRGIKAMHADIQQWSFFHFHPKDYCNTDAVTFVAPRLEIQSPGVYLESLQIALEKRLLLHLAHNWF